MSPGQGAAWLPGSPGWCLAELRPPEAQSPGAGFLLPGNRYPQLAGAATWAGETAATPRCRLRSPVVLLKLARHVHGCGGDARSRNPQGPTETARQRCGAPASQAGNDLARAVLVPGVRCRAWPRYEVGAGRSPALPPQFACSGQNVTNRGDIPPLPECRTRKATGRLLAGRGLCLLCQGRSRSLSFGRAAAAPGSPFARPEPGSGWRAWPGGVWPGHSANQ